MCARMELLLKLRTFMLMSYHSSNCTYNATNSSHIQAMNVLMQMPKLPINHLKAGHSTGIQHALLLQ